MPTENIKIFVCHHKDTPVFKNKIITPIHSGCALADIELAGMIGDNSGDNISHKNNSWCELTVLYWKIIGNKTNISKNKHIS